MSLLFFFELQGFIVGCKPHSRLLLCCCVGRIPPALREYGSGYAFASVRLGVAQCRRESWQQWGFIPGNGPLLCGVCSVEVCGDHPYIMKICCYIFFLNPRAVSLFGDPW